MVTRDGFILGIHNYCDRWCERCPLTHRCRAFADERQLEFHLAPPDQASPGLTAGVHDEPASRDCLLGDVADPRVDADAQALQVRLDALTSRLHDWSLVALPSNDPEVREAREVLAHYWLVTGAKLQQALRGAAHEAGAGTADASGSAKVVLLALDRLEGAWLRLAERGCVSLDEAEPLLQECAAVKAHVERRFPRARQFVRPGFDEPTAVAMLEWEERG